MQENKQKNVTSQNRTPEKKEKHENDSNVHFPRVPNPESDKNKMLQQNDIE